jgi:hypothetical protein
MDLLETALVALTVISIGVTVFVIVALIRGRWWR